MRTRIIAAVAAAASMLAVFIGLDILEMKPVFAGDPAKPAETRPAAGDSLEAEKGMLAVLGRKEKELREREEELMRNEERLNTVRADIEARLSELKAEHERIAALVSKIEEINDQRNKKIVKIYESMSPEEAASRLEKLDDEMAVMILALMSERKAAKVLSFVDVSRSAKLSRSLRIKD